MYDSPVELHDQQLSQPEYRFFECLQERPQTSPLTVSEENLKHSKLQKRTLPVLALNEVYLGKWLSTPGIKFQPKTSIIDQFLAFQVNASPPESPTLKFPPPPHHPESGSRQKMRAFASPPGPDRPHGPTIFPRYLVKLCRNFCKLWMAL